MEILPADIVIYADDAALYRALAAFDSVGVNVATSVFPGASETTVS